MCSKFYRNILNCCLGLIYALFSVAYFVALFDERLHKEWVVEEPFYMQSKLHYVGFIITNIIIFLILREKT